MKILLVAGARPNFMKIAPIFRACRKKSEIDCKIIHTGQHYDFEMSQAFFKDLELPEPHYYLKSGSGSHAVQTAKIMVAFEKVCLQEQPGWVVVVGDVNSTLACSITAKKLHLRVAHVEAGLRSFDQSMPEEINRIVTDSIADCLFVTEESGLKNLLREGKQREQIHFVGNVMIDNLFYQKKKLDNQNPQELSTFQLKNETKKYVFLTLHRPSNVDHRDKFMGIARALNQIAEENPIIFPVHPRTKKMIDHHCINLSKNIIMIKPLSFLESLYLWQDAEVVLTDSGGLQEETTALGVPCVTIRENTERPITLEMGTNILAGTDPDAIIKAYMQAKINGRKNSCPPLWDGKAAERIVDILLRYNT